MTARRFSMWNATGKVSLRAVLDDIDGAGLIWIIGFFDGIGRPPSRFFSDSIGDFEQYLSESDQGFQVSWTELLQFAEGIQDLMEIDVSGFHEVDHRRIKRVTVQGWDATEWTITFEG